MPPSQHNLEQLASLVRQRNAVESSIAELIGRPGQLGHVGEFLAAAVFDIELEQSASAPGSDGTFRSGTLERRSVNVKWYSGTGLLDITPAYLPDYYLVLAASALSAESSKGKTRPWAIANVYLFSADSLVADLREAGVNIGTATSVRKHFWTSAEIFPREDGPLQLTEQQRQALALFAPAS